MTLAIKLTQADRLVASGRLSEAEAMLDALPPSRVTERLRQIIEIFRSSGLDVRAQNLARKWPASNDASSFCLTPRGFKSTLVVFTDLFGNFWLSPAMLASWLAPHQCRILFLRAPQHRHFLTGQTNILAWSQSIRKSIHAILGSDVENIRITGFSGGGFASLAVASQIPFSRHLGFSIRTNLDPQSSFPHEGHLGGDMRPVYVAAGLGEEWDLRSFMATHGNHTVSRIVVPRHSAIDRAHANNLEGLPGIALQWLDSPSHNTVKECILTGKLSACFQELLS